MRHIIHVTGFFLILGIFLIGCDSVVDSEIDDPMLRPGQSSNNNVGAQAITCQPAGSTGLTAVYVNQSVIGVTIDFGEHDCDMAVYFDEDAPRNAVVRNTTIIQETGVGGVVMGVWNNGGDVTVTNSTFTTDVTGQYLPIRFDNGSKGVISGNRLSGNHRVGILIGDGTNVQVRGNSVTGTGAKTSGWAENGIQIYQGATASVVNNTFEGHWWDGEGGWASTGILLFGVDDVDVTNNTLKDNEFSIYVDGSNNRGSGNRTSSEIVSQFRAWGIIISGSQNHFAGNNFTADDGAVGIYIFSDSENNRITGNRISGFEWPILDGGDDTMIRGKPTPVISF